MESSYAQLLFSASVISSSQEDKIEEIRLIILSADIALMHSTSSKSTYSLVVSIRVLLLLITGTTNFAIYTSVYCGVMWNKCSVLLVTG